MSTSRNSSRLAKRIRRQTSLTQSTASRLAKQVHTYLGPPVADSPEPDQRRLEAHVAHVLASRFQDRQLNGALLGVQEARPVSGYLELTLESAMADEVLRELLPRFDESFGGIRGVPGLRFLPADREVVLHDALSQAHITVRRADGRAWSLPTARDGETPLWNRTRSGLSQDEGEEARWWSESHPSLLDARMRDLVMSRILRRPALVNRAAEPHGFANCYTHHSGDLVIEWCCGDTVEAFCGALLAHGFIDGLPPTEAIELTSPQSARLAGHTVILRRHSSCLYGHEPFSPRRITGYIREGYVS
ncbi:hypothetical protein ACWEF9_34630 [Streptomyces sp. NPDC004980]